jgi:hypothetical protein
MQGQAGKGFGIQKNPQTARGLEFKITPKPKRKDWDKNDSKNPQTTRGLGAKHFKRIKEVV